MLNLSINNIFAPGSALPIRTSAGQYQGAPIDPPGAGKTKDALGDGYFMLHPWSSTHASRNWAQRVVDGDYDSWLSSFANDIAAFASLNSHGGQNINSLRNEPTFNSTTNAKGADLAGSGNELAYNNVIVRFAFEPNGRLAHSIPDHDATDWERGRDEYVAAWAYVSEHVRAIADNAYFFYCFSHNATTQPKAPAYDGLSGPAKPAWVDTLRTRQHVQFLGMDLYEDAGDGDFSGGVANPMLDHSTQPYDNWEAIFLDYGSAETPMLIGEWGITLTHRDSTGLTGNARKRKWPCAQDATAANWNEECRGRWIRESLVYIKDFRDGTNADHSKYKALKGMFYFNLDRANESPNHIWGLYSGTSSFVPKDDSGNDREPRPTLALAATTAWKASGIAGTENNYSFRRWCQSNNANPYDATYRGHNGSSTPGGIFAENVPDNSVL